MTADERAATAVVWRFFESCAAGAYVKAAELFTAPLLALERSVLERELEPPPAVEAYMAAHPDLSEDDAREKLDAWASQLRERLPFEVARIDSPTDMAALSDLELFARRLEAVDPISHQRHDFDAARVRYPEYEEQLREQSERMAAFWDFEHVGTLIASNGRAYVLYLPPAGDDPTTRAMEPEPHQVVLQPTAEGWRIATFPRPNIIRLLRRRGLPVRVTNADGEDILLSLDEPR